MKNEIIKFRVSKIEQRIIQKKSEKAGLSISEFLRRLALEKEIKRDPASKAYYQARMGYYYIEEKDYATSQFLQWFVDEQVEEESTLVDIITRLEKVPTPIGIMMMDDRLGQRA